MTAKNLLISALSLVFFSSCKQLKTLSARDNSSVKADQKPKASRQVRFLENISITPGQVSTTRHRSIGPSVPKNISVKEPNEKPSYATGGDLERGDWLQVKYALMLNSSPENLTNTGLLKLIDEWWATPYSMGGSTKDGIDCSAFTQVIMSNVYGISLPRTSGEQYKYSQQIDDEQLQEGDLVFFHSGRSISHVGIYLMNNKFVHASTSQGVMISDLNDSYWHSKYKGGGRVRRE